MKTKNTEEIKPSNPRAFPDSSMVDNLGMTLRDYFAAKAMQAYISTYSSQTSAEQIKSHSEYISTMAYEIADSMLRQR